MIDKSQEINSQNFETMTSNDSGAQKNPIIRMRNLYSKNPKIFIALSATAFILILSMVISSFLPKKQQQNGSQNPASYPGQTITGSQNPQPDLQESDLTKVEKAIKSDDLFESSLMPPILDMQVSF
jgi:hypothetical protein